MRLLIFFAPYNSYMAMYVPLFLSFLLICSNRCSFAHPASYFLHSITLFYFFFSRFAFSPFHPPFRRQGAQQAGSKPGGAVDARSRHEVEDATGRGEVNAGQRVASSAQRWSRLKKKVETRADLAHPRIPCDRTGLTSATRAAGGRWRE